MKNGPTFRLVILSAALALLNLFAGCGTTKPTNFYLMTSLVHQEAADAGDEPAVGVGPLVLAEYLDRPQIVSRTNENMLQLAVFHQWAEPLKDSLLRILTMNLSVLLSSNNVVPFPWKGHAAMDCQVVVEIDRFERGPEGDVILTARWMLIDPQSKQPARIHRSFIRRPAGDEDDFAALAGVMSQAFGDLSREIAAAITEPGS